MDKKLKFIDLVALTVKSFGFNDDVSLFIACQFALESDFGTSCLAFEYNNYSGMRCPIVGLSTALNIGDVNSTWAHYYNLYDCITDFVLCLQYYKPLSDIRVDIDAYCRFISRLYCRERDYISKINTIYSQFKNYKK